MAAGPRPCDDSDARERVVSFCVPRTDWNTHQKTPQLVHEDVAAELLDFFMNNRAALGSLPNDHPFARKIRFARQTLWVEDTKPGSLPTIPQASRPADIPPALQPSWHDTAISMRTAGKSWEEIVKVVDQPKSTVRRAVNQALAGARG